jgi:hypothetical protein
MRTRTTIAILCLGCLVVPSRADDSSSYKPIDPETVAAYKKLGAKFAVLDVYPRVQSFPAKDSEPQQLPVFRLASRWDGTLPELPPVGVPFGLHLRGTNVKDAGLTELKNVKNLTALELGLTRVTDEGMKELKGLKNLASLYL